MEGTAHVDARMRSPGNPARRRRGGTQALGRGLRRADPTISTGSNARSPRLWPGSCWSDIGDDATPASGAQNLAGASRLTPRLMRNLKLAFRTLFRTPFVTVVAVVSLALGIGATAAIFSLFNQMLLRPLPVRAPEQLVNLSAPGPKPGSNSCNQAGDCDDVFSYAMFRDLEKAQAVFTGLAAHRIFGANLRLQRADAVGLGHARVGELLPDAWRAACPGPDARARATTAWSANRASSCSASTTGRSALASTRRS